MGSNYKARELVDASNALLVEYLREPHTIPEIAKFLECHPNNVIKRINMLDKLGIPIVKMLGRPVRYIALT